jgi:hypothetical protein
MNAGQVRTQLPVQVGGYCLRDFVDRIPFTAR